MSDEKMEAIHARMRHAGTLSDEAVMSGDNDQPFLKFCAAHYIPDTHDLLAEIRCQRAAQEALVTAARAVLAIAPFTATPTQIELIQVQVRAALSGYERQHATR